MAAITVFWSADSLQTPVSDAMLGHAHVALDDVELHAEDSVVHDVAQDSGIGHTHPPREERSVGPVHAVVSEWRKAEQRYTDCFPVHIVYVISTKLVPGRTPSEEWMRRLPRLRSAGCVPSRLNSAEGEWRRAASREAVRAELGPRHDKQQRSR